MPLPPLYSPIFFFNAFQATLNGALANEFNIAILLYLACWFTIKNKLLHDDLVFGADGTDWHTDEKAILAPVNIIVRSAV